MISTIKNIWFYLLLILSSYSSLNAQVIEFEQIRPPLPSPQNTIDISSFYHADVEYSDIDGDNDQDLIIVGHNGSERITELLENDGTGNYSRKQPSIADVSEGSASFADIDSDGDKDLLISGINVSTAHITKLYKNDGNGNFAIDNSAPFTGVAYSSISFADIDGDLDQDVLISGETYTNDRITELYTNDGNGNFTIVNGTPFDGLYNGDIEFADVDGDLDQDVLITGISATGFAIAKMYTNDGNGSFSEVLGTPFYGVTRGSVAFTDVDGDLDQDVLITGKGIGQIANLFVNNGTGTFTEVLGTPFQGVDHSSIGFADVDGDLDQDVLITGSFWSGELYYVAELYLNDGVGNYTLDTSAPFDGVDWSAMAFSDIDGDNDQDVLITGQNSLGLLTSKHYINDGFGNFDEVVQTAFDGVFIGSMAFSDVDGDNDDDVLITGFSSFTTYRAQLYTNDGNGNFTDVPTVPFEGVQLSAIAFADIDGDNDEDVLITGADSLTQIISKVYKNDGAGNFTEINSVIEGVHRSAVAFADVDGDNDQDLIITGSNSSLVGITKLYLNDGNGSFSLATGTPFEGVFHSAVAFSDIDGDNDQDLLLSGQSAVTNFPITKLYLNNGSGTFTEVSTPFNDVHKGSIVFADVDNDNDQDVVVTGRELSGTRIARLFLNDGNGTFTPNNGTNMTGVSYSSVDFADVENDGDLDLIVTGMIGNTAEKTSLYKNNGVGNFTEVPNMIFDQVGYSSVGFSDVNNDGYSDLLITGRNEYNQLIAKLYGNHSSCLSPFSISFSGGSLTPSITGNSYQWIECSNGDSLITNAVDQTYTPTENGSYAVIITINGCSSTSNCLTISNLGLKNYDFQSFLKIYPNPTNGSIIVSFDYNIEIPKLVSIFNLTGDKIQSGFIKENESSIELSLSNLSSGVYFVHIESENNRIVKRIIKY